MSARSKARKRALDILFEAEIRREPPLRVLEDRTIQADPPVTSYAVELVQGVQAHRDEIDRLLAENSRGWTLARMPGVDRNILRIGSYELLWGTDVPDAVAISEAVLLARDLSTDESPGFVNGMLARVLELKPTLVGKEGGGEAAVPEVARDEAAMPEAGGDEAVLPEAGRDEAGGAAQEQNCQ